MAALSYQGAAILAPMVRVGSLPLRLLALQYGANIVYSPEIIDKKLLQATRHENTDNGTIEYRVDSRELVFQTCRAERHAIVLQIGTADPELALGAALMVQDDVNAVDVNMGCPKRFSVHAGMGAALLSDVERATAILRRLVGGLRVPVTCKIRIQDKEEDTLAFVRAVAATGISALAVHGRTRDMRPSNPAIWSQIRAIVGAVTPLPVILNGDVFTFADIARARADTGCAGIMIARAAQGNASVFRAEGLLPLHDVVRAFLGHALATGGHHALAKYTIQQMLTDNGLTSSPEWRAVTQAKEFAELCGVFGVVCPPGAGAPSKASLKAAARAAARAAAKQKADAKAAVWDAVQSACAVQTASADQTACAAETGAEADPPFDESGPPLKRARGLDA